MMECNEPAAMKGVTTQRWLSTVRAMCAEDVGMGKECHGFGLTTNIIRVGTRLFKINRFDGKVSYFK